MRILITGSRRWQDVTQLAAAISDAVGNLAWSEVTVVHGGARGADSQADRLAVEVGANVEVHPADWDKHGKAAGFIRNQEMVNLGADVCLAFPAGEARGTRDCMRRAGRAGIRVVSFEGPV